MFCVPISCLRHVRRFTEMYSRIANMFSPGITEIDLKRFAPKRRRNAVWKLIPLVFGVAWRILHHRFPYLIDNPWNLLLQASDGSLFCPGRNDNSFGYFSHLQGSLFLWPLGEFLCPLIMASSRFDEFIFNRRNRIQICTRNGFLHNRLSNIVFLRYFRFEAFLTHASEVESIQEQLYPGLRDLAVIGQILDEICVQVPR